MAEVVVSLPTKDRPYQRGLVENFRKGGKQAYCVWHRKAGKDRAATFIESELALQRKGLYWHALPAYSDARKVIWDAITLNGEKLLDVSFPKEMVKKKSEHEMKIELVNGSIWQPVGADNYDGLVGAFPVHVTYSEFALMHPNARNFLRPAIAMSGGSELIITTPRGYNHAYKLWQHAKKTPAWYTSLVTVNDSNVFSQADLDEEKATKSDELYRQEYMCDWSVANLGAILGRYIEAAELAGRITTVEYDPSLPVHVSSDIGFHDTATWWFWQVRPDGYALIDYDEDSGLDASEWIERIGDRPGGYRYERIWLPHDAKARTFATRKSAHEQFAKAFPTAIAPAVSKAHRIEAARKIARVSHWDKDKCHQGLEALREWSFEYNEDTHSFSKEPKHDWASHPGDGYSYGALVMQEYHPIKVKPKPEAKPLVTIDDFIAASEGGRQERTRI